MIGKTLGHYKILERIGGGGFATVYLGLDTRTNEVVAIKVLHTQYSQDKVFIDRFWREARAIYELSNHPNVVRLHEFGEAEGVYYLAMDYLEGQDLNQVLAQKGRLGVEEALRIVLQVVQALRFAHAQGIIHRDIKPANIKIMPNGVTRLMDFGIVKAAEEGTKLTKMGTFLGTPEYLAPEIWEGAPANIRTDIYALGVVLYEMLAGGAPFRADTVPAVMRKHLVESPPSLRTVRPEVPEWLETVVSRMLAKKPEERYQTPDELLAALQGKAATGQPIPTPVPVAPTPTPTPTPRPRRPSRWSSKPIWLWGAGGGVALLVAVVLTFNVWGGNGSAATPTPRVAMAPSSPTAVAPAPATPGQTPAATRAPAASAAATSGEDRTPTRTATATRTTTATPVPTRTATTLPPTATRVPTTPPTATRAPSPTPRPAPTGPPATAAPVYAAPVLLAPDDGATLTFPVTLRWSWNGTLQEDEWFDVRVWPEGLPHYGIAWTKEPQVVVANPGIQIQGTVYWSVAVIRGRDGKWQADRSPEAAARRAVISSGGGRGGGGLRPEPSPTR